MVHKAIANLESSNLNRKEHILTSGMMYLGAVSGCWENKSCFRLPRGRKGKGCLCVRYSQRTRAAAHS